MRLVFAFVLAAVLAACAGTPPPEPELPPPPPPPAPAYVLEEEEPTPEAPATADSDGDGIADGDDKCRLEPEDADLFQDEDGCPDPDNDGDGVADATDMCPNMPETVNGNQDEDGCPDVGVAQRVEPVRPATSVAATPPPATSRAIADVDQQRWVIAVMDVDLVGASIAKQTQRALSDQIRIYLGQRRMKVVDRGAQETAMKGMVDEEKKKSYSSCVDASCQIPLGKALAATHILRTSIAGFDPKTCTTNGELIDLQREVTVAAASVPGECRPADLLQASERLADQLVRESANR